MSSVDKALATQLKNIQTRTGKSLDELVLLINESGLSKHKEKVDMLKSSLGMGHGDANTMVHYAKNQAADNEGSNNIQPDDPLDLIYVDKKAHLRGIHEKLLTELNGFGVFETAPKKGYISYRRKKQFAMIGPATNSRVELGLNVKDLPEDSRLVIQPKGKMCNYIVWLH